MSDDLFARLVKKEISPSKYEELKEFRDTIGKRVKVVKEYETDDIVNKYATIVTVKKSNRKITKDSIRYGIEFDEPIRLGHMLNGEAKSLHGWWIPADCVVFIDE